MMRTPVRQIGRKADLVARSAPEGRGHRDVPETILPSAITEVPQLYVVIPVVI